VNAAAVGVIGLKRQSVRSFEAATAKKSWLGKTDGETFCFSTNIDRFNRAQSSDIVLAGWEAGHISAGRSDDERIHFFRGQQARHQAEPGLTSFRRSPNEDIKWLIRRLVADKERGVGKIQHPIGRRRTESLGDDLPDGARGRGGGMATEVAVLSMHPKEARKVAQARRPKENAGKNRGGGEEPPFVALTDAVVP